jgi:hypothetical protein
MGAFEGFKTKTHFNSLKWLVAITALAALAVKLLAVALATAAGDGTPLDLLARVPASVADLGASLLVFEVLRTRRPSSSPPARRSWSPSARCCSWPRGSTATRRGWPWRCCCWPCTCAWTGTPPWSPASPWRSPPGSSR